MPSSRSVRGGARWRCQVVQNPVVGGQGAAGPWEGRAEQGGWGEEEEVGMEMFTGE